MNLHDALAAANIPPPPAAGNPISGGFIRYGKSNRYWLKQQDGVALFGDWTTGESHHWFEDNGKTLDPEQMAARKQKLAAIRKEQEAEQQRIHNEIAERASGIWDKLPETGASAYLSKKQVHTYGIRFTQDAVVIPIGDLEGKLWSLQYIFHDGTKRFLTGGRKKGCCHIIGTITNRVFIAEGYATAASIHMATSLPVVVVFDAGNIEPVIESLRKKSPALHITIAADNDQWGEQNTGKDKANAAAHSYGCMVVLPEFMDTVKKEKPTDFNDLHVLEGLEAVKAQVLAGDTKIVGNSNASDSSYRIMRGQKTRRDGVYYFDPAGDNDPVWICSPLEITARAHDGQGQGWGYLLEWNDPDGRHHSWPMPSEMLAGQGDEYRRELLNGGLQIAPGGKAKNHLTTYIQTASTDNRVRCTDRIGWHNGVFVLPCGTLGENKERVLYQSIAIAKHAFKENGTLEDWREYVALPATGNSRAMFAISCAFAPALLDAAGEESGGFHFRGDSSSGKTTVLKLAASVWGSPEYVQRWRATTNGLEGLAQLHNDCLLILDELAQVDPKEAGEIAYMLGNGSGKVRSSREGTARKAARWRLLYLSAGEIGLGDHVRLSGREVKAGQEIRLADIPADAGKGLGIFDLLPAGYDNPAALSRSLCDGATKYYGTAGIAFLEYLIANLPTLPGWMQKHRRNFMQSVVPQGASGQVERVAGRFALVAIAGELSSHLGLTGWEEGKAEEAAKICFRAWLEGRGGAGNMEAQKLLADIRAQLEAHGESRFAVIGKDDGRPTINRMGFIREADGEREYIVLPEAFKRELCKGHDSGKAIKTLLGMGILMPDSDNKPQRRESLPGMSRTRCYVLKANKLWEGDHGA